MPWAYQKFCYYWSLSIDDKRILAVIKLKCSHLIKSSQPYLLVIHHALSENFQCRVPRKMRSLISTTLWSWCSYFSPIFPFQLGSLCLILVTPRIGGNDAWVKSHSSFRRCLNPSFENCALIPFFYHALNPKVMAEVSFYKS